MLQEDQDRLQHEHDRLKEKRDQLQYELDRQHDEQDRQKEEHDQLQDEMVEQDRLHCPKILEIKITLLKPKLYKMQPYSLLHAKDPYTLCITPA
jgi:hypothetical protein